MARANEPFVFMASGFSRCRTAAMKCYTAYGPAAVTRVLPKRFSEGVLATFGKIFEDPPSFGRTPSPQIQKSDAFLSVGFFLSGISRCSTAATKCYTAYGPTAVTRVLPKGFSEGVLATFGKIFEDPRSFAKCISQGIASLTLHLWQAS